MKIQDLAIIFTIIILPISILLSEYTQFQIQTLNTQTLYDSKLTAATYDAIKAFQINAQNSTTSDLNSSQERDLEGGIQTFRNLIQTSFELTGYSQEELNNYIPALVYTLYDGFYIYSPYENTHDEFGNRVSGEQEAIYGLKPYISYSCRYIRGTNIDVVITYSLDNYVTVQGQINGEYVNKSGYLIDNITVIDNGDSVIDNDDTVIYNNIKIETEHLKEEIIIGDEVKNCSYVKINGFKCYLVEDYKELNGEYKDCIIRSLNGTLGVQTEEGMESFNNYLSLIENNTAAKQYYIEAYEFSKWFKNTDLVDLTYADAHDEASNTKIWADNDKKIFDFNTSFNPSDNIENELSNFNQHRLAIIRHKVETNLAIAIANYNEYSNVHNVFQMPELQEDEWNQITHNISLISFLQGLPIGGKLYNGYALVTNSESKEVVREESIYILGYDSDKSGYYYHKVNDIGFQDGTISIDAGDYQDGTGDIRSAGRLNLDFERTSVSGGINGSLYYYPLKEYNASYNSMVMQDNIETYNDIYEYVNNQNDDLKIAFYTALGRERYGMYKPEKTIDEVVNSLIYVEIPGGIPEETPEETKYVITYDANGGSGAPANQEKNAGESIQLSSDIPTKEGYDFKNWYTASGAIYSPGDLYTIDADLHLLAEWEYIPKTYTVDYNANGGEGAPVSQTKTEGVPLTLTTVQPTREGYEFLGWATISTAITYEYTSGGMYIEDKSVTLYAVWQQETIETYTITLDANGGIFPDDNSTKKIITVNKGDTIPSVAWPEKSGYAPQGWHPTRFTNDPKYTSLTSIIPEADMTLYVIWGTNGGLAQNPSNEIIKVLSSKNITIAGIMINIGMRFNSWLIPRL